LSKTRRKHSAHPAAPGALTLAKKHKPSVMLLEAAIRGGDAFDLVRELSGLPIACSRTSAEKTWSQPSKKKLRENQ
jgi:hypothetical protein